MRAYKPLLAVQETIDYTKILTEAVSIPGTQISCIKHRNQQDQQPRLYASQLQSLTSNLTVALQNWELA